jgi:hypothetical protein
MNEKELLDGFFYKLKEIRESKGMIHIDELKPDDKQPHSFYSDVTGRHRKIIELPLFLYEDLSYFSTDIIHFTSLIFLLRPFINDARKEKGTYFQNWYDARYLSYVSILYSTVYKFWDRIGDLLNCFFKTGISADQVYIGRVISNFPKNDRISKHFIDLNNIYITHVRNIIYESNEDAHNQSIVASHFYGIIVAHSEDQIEKTELKFNLPEIFNDQIKYANLGFELAVRLIEERGQKL